MFRGVGRLRVFAAGLVPLIVAGSILVVAAIAPDRDAREAPNDEVVVQSASFPRDGGGFESQWNPLERLFVRTTQDGVTIRAYLEDLSDQSGPEAWSPGWEPPPWCYPTGAVQTAMSTDATVGRGSSYVYAEPPDGLSVEHGLIGLREGEPVWWVSVQASVAATIRARFADGGIDEMAAVDDVAVLARAAPPVTVDSERDYSEVYESLANAPVTVEVLDTGGTVVASRDLHTYQPVHDDRCDAPPPLPPTLPEPGPEQPSDVESARLAVVGAYTDAFTGSKADAVRLAAIERGDELAGVLAEIDKGGYAQIVESATAKVRDVVFLSATEAAVAYDIVVEALSDLPTYTGRAVFTEGRWKVARDTVCGVLQFVAASCPEEKSSGSEGG